MRKAVFLFVLLMATGCASVAAERHDTYDGIARAPINQRVYVDGPHVTPLEVLEDSRCPANVQCVWAGRLRLSIKIDLGAGSHIREIATDAPIHVADGQLALVEVQPARITDKPIKQNEYRFGFTFAGGI